MVFVPFWIRLVIEKDMKFVFKSVKKYVEPRFEKKKWELAKCSRLRTSVSFKTFEKHPLLAWLWNVKIAKRRFRDKFLDHC